MPPPPPPPRHWTACSTVRIQYCRRLSSQLKFSLSAAALCIYLYGLTFFLEALIRGGGGFIEDEWVWEAGKVSLELQEVEATPVLVRNQRVRCESQVQIPANALQIAPATREKYLWASAVKTRSRFWPKSSRWPCNERRIFVSGGRETQVQIPANALREIVWLLGKNVLPINSWMCVLCFYCT